MPALPGGREPVDVVVVDDVEEVRAVVVQSLSLDGRFRVVGEAATGAGALALARCHHPSLMLLDASMPDMDGLTALPDVLECSPDTRVVLFSGFASAALAAAARSLGAADVVDKATPVRALSRRLLQVAGREVADRAEVAGRAEVTDPVEETEASRASGGAGGAEAVLARHLERFGAVFDQGTVGMATTTLTGTIVRANPALCRMLTLDERDLVARSYTALTVERTAPALVAAIADVASGRQRVVRIEHRLASPGERWMRSTVAAVSDAQGAPLYLFTQAEETTEQRIAAEALRRSEERFRLLVEGVRDYAIFMLDPTGHVTTWNLGAERMKGYTADEIVGEHFRVFYEEAARVARHPEHELQRAVAAGRYEEEGWRLRKDGSRFWANVVITALYDRTGSLAGFAKVTRDVTERREAAEARERFTAELASTNEVLKAAAKQTAEFVAMTAHELRSPTAAVTGAASILRDYWDVLDAPQRAEALDSLLRGGNRLRRLIEDLLTVSRLEAGSFQFDLEVVTLGAVVGEVAADHAVVLGEVAVDGALGVSVKADRVRCAQIVSNLLANAGLHGAPPVRVAVSANGHRAEVRVFDGGEALPESVTDRLFEKFVRVGRGEGRGGRGRHDGHDGRDGRDGRGTGLGLFIVRELARGQGGDAWYERTATGATCFAFSLPFA